MFILRKASDRFHTKIDWLDSWHSFSFAEHYDPRHIGFGPLRVINDDRIAAGAGFPEHPHRDMEIITVVLEGRLQHKDSLGIGSVIAPGDVQKMSAGSGIRHSEFNASNIEPVHLLQIWIVPDKSGIKPAYAQVNFPDEKRRNQWCLAASPDGAQESITLQQNARLYISDLAAGASIAYPISSGRQIWVQIAKGKAKIGELALQEGDGLAVMNESSLDLTAQSDSTILLFDLMN